MSQSYPPPPVVPGVPYQQQPTLLGQAMPTAQPPPDLPAVLQPTVRVMRLYKPCMHVVPTMPHIADSAMGKAVDFAISPFLLLPDSFGDIYTGELFSAYIAVVNGNQEEALMQVSLSVRLQTANSTYDLPDCRAIMGETSGFARHLGPNQSIDVVVRHTLNELGTHTLRVAVQYVTRYAPNEPKTLRKFYRFNVLQPLSMSALAIDVGPRMMVQCQLTNITKSPVYIEDANFTPYSKEAEVRAITVPDGVRSSSSSSSQPSNEVTTINAAAMPLLWPDESYALSFTVSRPIGQVIKFAGFAEVKWCSYMGEHGVLRSEDALVLEDINSHSSSSTSGAALSSSSSAAAAASSGGASGELSSHKTVRIDCVSAPTEVIVGVDFTVLLRVTNNGSHALSLQLLSREPPLAYSSSPSAAAPSSLFYAGDTSGAYYDSSRLCVTGLASAKIGVLGAGKSFDCPITVCAISTGLQELKNLSVVDLSTSIEYPSGSLCKVFVTEDRS